MKKKGVRILSQSSLINYNKKLLNSKNYNKKAYKQCQCLFFTIKRQTKLNIKSFWVRKDFGINIFGKFVYKFIFLNENSSINIY